MRGQLLCVFLRYWFRFFSVMRQWLNYSRNPSRGGGVALIYIAP